MAIIDEKAKGEILSRYKLAKNKIEQIGILSELFATSTAEIRGILYEGGFYKIGPREILDAAARIEKGTTFGGLRNVARGFAEHDAKAAKKVFNDFAYRPWGIETPEETETIVKRVDEILEFTKTRAAHREQKEKTVAKIPAAVPAFTDYQCGAMIAGLVMLVAEQEARAQQYKHDIDRMQAEAQRLIDDSAAKLEELSALQAEIEENKSLLDQVKEMKESMTKNGG